MSDLDVQLLLAELAHELRQPLSGIRAAAELLGEARKNDEAVRARTDAIVRQARRIELIVERVRRMGAPAPAAARCADAREVAEASIALLADRAKEASVRVNLDAAAGLPYAAIEPVALEQIVSNLLRNAIEALPGGGSVDVRLSGTSGRLEVVVADDGPGVPATVRANLFDRFVSGRPGGTGLGLHISRELATEAGGTLELLDEPGSGARFRLQLGTANP